MKKSELIESWLNSEISEDEAILILERMKHDDNFTREIVESGEIHACLYTIFHEDKSFEELKLHEESKSPEEIEEQIMAMINDGAPKQKEKKKRITVVDLPQKISVQTSSFNDKKNYWPMLGGIAALLVIILSVAIISQRETPNEVVDENNSLSEDEKVSLVKDKSRQKIKPKSQKKNRVADIPKPVNPVPVQTANIEAEIKIADTGKKSPDEKVKQNVNPLPDTDKAPQFIGHFSYNSDYSSILRNGESLDVVKDLKIVDGDVLSTSFEAGAEIYLIDGSKVVVDPSSELSISSQKIIVSKGKVKFKVNKQKEGVFQVFSGETETTVVGTEFTVSYLHRLSQVKVLGGIVKVKSQNHEVTLEKGQGAISRDGEKPQKRYYSEQFGLLAAKWKGDDIGPQVSIKEFDITDFVTSNGYHDLYFKKSDDDTKGMLQIFKVEFYENGKLIAVDEHDGVTSNHTTDLRNRNVWLHGGYGSSMYRMYLRSFSIDNKYTVKVRCRSFKGSCDGEVWLLTTVPNSPTLKPGVIPKGRNLAYKKKTSVEKGSFSSNHGPSMVVDNKITPESSWWGGGSSWVQIDLGKETDFNSMFVANFWEQNCYHQYFVEVSKDGEKWDQVIDMTENTLPAHETGQFHRFDSVQARYVRMTVNKVKFSQGGISVVEIKVFNFN